MHLPYHAPLLTPFTMQGVLEVVSEIVLLVGRMAGLTTDRTSAVMTKTPVLLTYWLNQKLSALR